MTSAIEDLEQVQECLDNLHQALQSANANLISQTSAALAARLRIRELQPCGPLENADLSRGLELLRKITHLNELNQELCLSAIRTVRQCAASLAQTAQGQRN